MTTKITNANLANTGVTAGSYTNSSLTINAQGQITAASSGAGTSPGGSTTQIQYNNAGAFGGSSNLTFDGTNLTSGGTVTATKLIPTGNVTAGNGMYLPTTNTLAFSTNGSERMRITSSGDVDVSNFVQTDKLRGRSTVNWGAGDYPSGRGFSWTLEGTMFTSGYVAASATTNVITMNNSPGGLFMIEMSRADNGGGPYGNTSGWGLALYLVNSQNHGWSNGSSTLIASLGTLHGTFTNGDWYTCSITGGTGGTYYRIMWLN